MALIVGWGALLQQVRRTPGRWHRRFGYLYTGGVALGILSGLILLPRATQGGLAGQLGLSYGLLLWSYFTFAMVVSARRRDYTAHLRWAFRSYAISFSGVTLRFILKSGLVMGLSHQSAYALAACACFAFNVLLAEILWARHGLPEHFS